MQLRGQPHGAAILAAVGVGEYKMFPKYLNYGFKKQRPYYLYNDMEAYKERYPIYRFLYPSLKENFETIAQVDS